MPNDVVADHRGPGRGRFRLHGPFRFLITHSPTVQ